MRTLDRNKRKIYLAKKSEVEYDDEGNQIVKYEDAIPLKINHVPISGDSDTQAFGEKFDQIQRAVVNKRDGSKFKEYDLVYLDGASPYIKPDWYEDENWQGYEPINGDYANYRVKSSRLQLNEYLIYFEKLTGKN